jgi:hypothetical protein
VALLLTPRSQAPLHIALTIAKPHFISIRLFFNQKTCLLISMHLFIHWPEKHPRSAANMQAQNSAQRTKVPLSPFTRLKLAFFRILAFVKFQHILSRVARLATISIQPIHFARQSRLPSVNIQWQTPKTVYQLIDASIENPRQREQTCQDGENSRREPREVCSLSLPI